MRRAATGALAVALAWLVCAASGASAHTSPEYFWGSPSHGFGLTGYSNWGHYHTVWEVSARKNTLINSTTVCVYSYYRSGGGLSNAGCAYAGTGLIVVPTDSAWQRGIAYVPSGNPYVRAREAF